MEIERTPGVCKKQRMPDGDSIGFKEWAFVCEALGQGVQTIILRKGGIHEGRGGFQFQHDAFWLFPTGFHNQGDQLRWTPPDAPAIAVPRDEERETVNVRYHARLHHLWRVTDWDKVRALEPLHVWKEEVVRERFMWDEESCLHAALVRVSALPRTWTFPYERGYGGCRSWVKLPAGGAALEKDLRPVLTDAAWDAAAAKVRAILD
jgi:hypothetical protein